MIKRAVLILLISSVVSIPIALVQHTRVSAQGMTTCFDIRVQYPNGVAKNKKVRALKTFRKAVVNQQIYDTNQHLDIYGNDNGIVCDAKEKFTSVATFAGVISNFDGIEVELRVACAVENVALQYGFDVGYANLSFEARCDTTLKNKDKLYSYYLNGYAVEVMYLVFDDLVTDKVDQSRKRASQELDKSRFSRRTVSPGGWGSDRLTTKGLIVGTKSEIESLYQRMKNGLVPNLYLGRGWGEPQGCFTQIQRPPYEKVTVSVSSSCTEYMEQIDSDGYYFGTYRNSWDS